MWRTLNNFEQKAVIRFHNELLTAASDDSQKKFQLERPALKSDPN